MDGDNKPLFDCRVHRLVHAIIIIVEKKNYQRFDHLCCFAIKGRIPVNWKLIAILVIFMGETWRSFILFSKRKWKALEAFFTPVASNRDLKPFCARIRSKISLLPDTFNNSGSCLEVSSRKGKLKFSFLFLGVGKSLRDVFNRFTLNTSILNVVILAEHEKFSFASLSLSPTRLHLRPLLS